jgi:hypothetical protein
VRWKFSAGMLSRLLIAADVAFLGRDLFISSAFCYALKRLARYG